MLLAVSRRRYSIRLALVAIMAQELLNVLKVSRTEQKVCLPLSDCG